MCRPMVHSFITLSQTLILSPCPLLQFFLKKQTNPKQTNKTAKKTKNQQKQKKQNKTSKQKNTQQQQQQRSNKKQNKNTKQTNLKQSVEASG